MSIESFKEGETETLRRVLTILTRLSQEHSVMIPKGKLERVVENLLKLESGVDSTLIIGGVSNKYKNQNK